MPQEQERVTTIIDDVRIFDGERVIGPRTVTLSGGTISSIAEAERSPQSSDSDGARHIDGSGDVLIPGLIDAHWHSMFAGISALGALTANPGFLYVLAGKIAGQVLTQGFTTVRDAGGPSFGLKQAIDAGIIEGPRIYPSGAMISQTGGHADFRFLNDLPRGLSGWLSHAERIGAVSIVDGEAEVLRAAREQLQRGATQLKLTAGGGVASSYDPLDVTQFTERELHAAVEAAENWGTYVMVHAYTPRAVQQAIRAGVKCIDHGQLLDRATVELMAENDTWWSLQPFLGGDLANPSEGKNAAKQRLVEEGTARAYELAREIDVKVAWGTDILFAPSLVGNHGAKLGELTPWYTPAEIIRMATTTNAELLSLSGPRNPYPGRLGVVEEGAIADLILVDGDPTADITLLARPEQAFRAVFKGGRVVAGTLHRQE